MYNPSYGIDSAAASYLPLSPEGLKALDAIEYITEHLKQDEEYKIVRLFHKTDLTFTVSG